MKALAYWLVFSTTFLYAAGDYEENFLGKANGDTDADGVVVYVGLKSISINENREVPEDGPNFIAEILYTGENVPRVAEVGGEGVKPVLSIHTSNEKIYLQIDNVLDFENRGLENWPVWLDPPTLAPFTVYVLDQNDLPPIFTTYAQEPIEVAELSLPEDPVLFEFTAVDTDTMDTALKFSMTDLQNGADTPFSIDPDTGALTLVTELDYQRQTNYRLQITVKDSGDIHSVNAPMITVVNVVDVPNLPPKWISVAYSVDIRENNVPALDPPLHTYVAVDDDFGVNSPIVYSLQNVPLTPGDNPEPYLIIHGTTGELRANVVIDADFVGIPAPFRFDVVATEVYEPYAVLSESVVLMIEDVNDNVPAFIDGTSEKFFEITIDENAVGSLPSLEELMIFDNDVSLVFHRFTARLTAENPEDEEWLNEFFQVAPAEGYRGGAFSVLIKPSAVIDFEDPRWQQVVEFNVRVEEYDDASRFALGKITLTVNDVNDNSPEFQNLNDNGVIEIEVYENVGVGRIATILALDKDASEIYGTNSIRYSWANSEPSHLILHESSGEISTRFDNAFDRETLALEVYIVEATDMGGDQRANSVPRTTTSVLHLVILDVNDEPPVITSGPRRIQIPENIEHQDGTPVFEPIQISDPDQTFELTASCSVSPGVAKTWFRCVIVPDEITGTLTVTIVMGEDPPDYEIENRVDILLTASDDAATQLQTTTETFTVNIDNVNDEPPKFDEVRLISVDETPSCPDDEFECQSDVEREFYQFRVTDMDSSPAQIRFRLEPTPFLEMDLVEIDEIDGILSRRSGARIDREQYSSFYISVTAINCGEDGNNCEEALATNLPQVEITVGDINDEVPIFSGDETQFSVTEEAIIGQEIFTFEATDADVGRYGLVYFYLDETYLEGNGFNEFQIVKETGVLSVRSPLDRETDPSFELRVLARDNAGSQSGYNEAARLVTITILDVNDNMPSFSNPDFPSKNENEIVPGTELGHVTVTDADEDGNPNSQLAVVLLEVTWTGCPNCEGLNWRELFEGRFDSSANVFKIYARINLHPLFGVYEFTIHAQDRGQVPQENEALYSFQILDINDNPPVITFPEVNTHVYVQQDLPVGSILKEYGAEGEDVPALMATDADDPTTDNAKVTFTINPEGDAHTYFQVVNILSQYYLAVKAPLVLSPDHVPIVVEVIATDGGIPPMEDRQSMEITVVPIVNMPPLFRNGLSTLELTENDGNFVATLEQATDPDTIGDTNVFGEVICYFIISGDEQISFQVTEDTNRLSLTEPLDREELAEYDLVILAKNNRPNQCQYPDPPPDPEDDSTSYLRLHVTVLDLKDTPPKFENPGPVIPGGIRISRGTIGSSTSIILRGIDPDLDDPLTFGIIQESIVASDPSIAPIETPFRLDENNEILITFLANEAMRGYFNFSVSVTDTVGSSATAQCKVYLTTESHLAEFKFDNDPISFEDDQLLDQVRQIFSDTYGYRCNIDIVRASTDSTGTPLMNKTTLETHFIDDAQNEPVPSYRITNLPYDDPTKYVNLIADLSNIGLTLEIGDGNSGGGDTPSDVLTFVLIGAVIALSTILILLTVTCWFNSRRLSLRVRALTAATFGSQASGLNHHGNLELPNTNQHAVEGSNPVWTKMDRRSRDFDAESVGSGGSVLIGVENDDDFRNYTGLSGPEDDFSFAFGSSKGAGAMNPIFGASYVDDGIEEEPAPLPPVVGRRNPLSMQDKAD